MIFFTAFTNYMLRANISVSIIEMVGKKGQRLIPVCARYWTINITTGNETVIANGEEKFDWDENEIADIFAGYYYGYVLALIPAALLAETIGPWHVIMWGSVGSTVLTALTPLSTVGGHYAVMGVRILVGLFGGSALPALHTLVANWAPPKEKGKFVAAMMGNNLGAVFAFSLVGIVTDYWGWPWGFYCLIVVMIIFCFFFFIFVRDTPSQSRWTSQEERHFIFEEQEGHLSDIKVVPPYRRILTSVPFLALCVAQFGNLWCFNLFLTYAPKYFAEVLGFEIKETAGLAALPYIARLFFSAFFGAIGDKLRKDKIMKVTQIRKFFVLFSHFLPGVCFFLMLITGCNPLGVGLLLVANQGLNGAIVVTQLINAQDLSPNFAGTCFGITNLFGMTSGALVPKIAGAISEYHNRELIASTMNFAIGGFVMVITGIVFVIFGSGKVQPWNEIQQPEATTSQGQKEIS